MACPTWMQLLARFSAYTRHSLRPSELCVQFSWYFNLGRASQYTDRIRIRPHKTM